MKTFIFLNKFHSSHIRHVQVRWLNKEQSEHKESFTAFIDYLLKYMTSKLFNIKLSWKSPINKYVYAVIIFIKLFNPASNEDVYQWIVAVK